MSEVVIYEAEDRRIAVNVRLDGETVWLTQRQMADVFGSSTDYISLHLKNIFSEGELDEPATTEDSSVVQRDWRRSPTPTTYSWPMISALVRTRCLML